MTLVLKGSGPRHFHNLKERDVPTNCRVSNRAGGDIDTGAGSVALGILCLAAVFNVKISVTHYEIPTALPEMAQASVTL
jgi:hypothetical protein